ARSAVAQRRRAPVQKNHRIAAPGPRNGVPVALRDGVPLAGTNGRPTPAHPRESGGPAEAHTYHRVFADRPVTTGSEVARADYSAAVRPAPPCPKRRSI